MDSSNVLLQYKLNTESKMKMKLAQRKYNAGDIIYGFSSIDLMAMKAVIR